MNDCSEPTMNVYDILRNVLNSFIDTNNEDALKNIYFFSSIKTKSDFKNYFKYKIFFKKQYNFFFNLKKWELISKPVYNKTDTLSICKIKLFTNQKIIIIEIHLNRQYNFIKNTPIFDEYNNICLNKYWRINEIIILESMIIETFSLSKNIFGKNLSVCNLNPITGFYRDGYCNTGENDLGKHTVCAEVSKEFLEYTKNQGNDLITPNDKYNFPGLKPNDYWCLCANRYKQAIENGIHLNVNKHATNVKTNKYINIK